MTAFVNTILILFATGITAHDEIFERAGEAYGQGDYAGAAELYEQLIAEGVYDAAVFYNLGNAYFRQDRYGAAIANFERALRRNPHAQAARQNRNLAIQNAPGGAGEHRIIPPWERGVMQVLAILKPEAPVWGALGAWVLFWALLAVRVWRPIRFVTGGATLALVVAVALGIGGWIRNQPSAIAVTSQPEVAARQGLDEESPERFRLAEGDRVIIDGEEGDWLRVVRIDGERGWAPATGFTRVGPPYSRAPAETHGGDPS